MEDVYEIQVLGLEFWGKHGVFDEERSEGRHFQIDLFARVDRLPGFETDELEDTVDYRRLAGLVTEVIEGESVRLVEHLADRIVRRCLRLEHVRCVEVAVRKRATGVPGSPRWVGVRLCRNRSATGYVS